jgi:hypothetical protein
MTTMPIDLAQVDWLYVVVLALFAFVASGVGNLLSFNHRGFGAVLTAAVFAAIFVFWTYYPHHIPLLPTSITVQKSPVTTVLPAAPATPSTPERPRNPITDITPPAGPSR